MGLDIYLDNKGKIEELDGKHYIEVNIWSIMKSVFVGQLLFALLVFGVFAIIGAIGIIAAIVL